MQRRDRGLRQSLGQVLNEKVKQGRVLLVGAGGIGCELLKNLVCCGFGTAPSLNGSSAATQGSSMLQETATPEIVVIDLDTIDLSNLNRQFLFRKQHIKKPKAFVAKETASQFNPAARISAHHASIFDAQYTVDFFESFDIVFNALDNLPARRHVNKMCLAANVPLIESGTTGFNGQVQAIKKGLTECYDCNPKPVQKSYPICTIRSTPSQPIHCIVWAKSYLFPELFGTSEEDSSDMTVTEGDNREEVAKLREEAEALKKIRAMMGKSEFAQEVFNKVFHEDIERLRSMSEMWQSRKPPESLSFAESTANTSILKQGQAVASQDQKPWNFHENISVFCYSLGALSQRVLAGEKTIDFDKDDKDALDFVASAANLRSHIFGIPLHSEWEIKQMAGNIIPAIATSNALAASLSVFEAFKVLRSQPPRSHTAPPSTSSNGFPTISHSNGTAASSNQQSNGKPEPLLGGARMVFLASKSTERTITTENLAPPHPNCPVCSPVYTKLLLPDPSATLPAPTLQDLVDLLRTHIPSYSDFAISADVGIVYDPDLEDNLEKPLTELGIGGEAKNGFVTVMDEDDEPMVDLVLSVIAQKAEDGQPPQMSLSLSEGTVLPKKVLPASKEAETTAHEGIMNGADTVEMVAVGEKRKRDAEEAGFTNGEVAKKARKSDGDEDMVLVGDGGAIDLTAD